MTDMTCPNCSGTGYTQDAAGEDVVCPLCEPLRRQPAAAAPDVVSKAPKPPMASALAAVRRDVGCPNPLTIRSNC